MLTQMPAIHSIDFQSKLHRVYDINVRTHRTLAPQNTRRPIQFGYFSGEFRARKIIFRHHQNTSNFSGRPKSKRKLTHWVSKKHCCAGWFVPVRSRLICMSRKQRTVVAVIVVFFPLLLD